MKYFILVILLLASFASEAVLMRPSKNHDEGMNIVDYGWMVVHPNIVLSVSMSEEAEKFFSKERTKKYFGLKMRNFVNRAKLVESSNENTNFMQLKIQLQNYNDKLEIYYGVMSLATEAAVDYGCSRPHALTLSLAGSKRQIEEEIKKNIDLFVEVYAEDFYYVEDLMKAALEKQKSSSN